MAKVIYESEIKELLLELAAGHRVIAPVISHPTSTFSQYAFSRFDKDSEIALSYAATILPPKEYLLPVREELFSYSKKDLKEPKPEKTILFGLSIEDLRGLERLKKIFEKPVLDEPVIGRYDATVVIGVDRFSPPADISFDLYLMEVSPRVYAGFAKTKAGQKVLKSRAFKNQRVKLPKVTKKKDDLLSDPLLSVAVGKSKDHPVWSELAEVCFGCGICSYVCPLCYCYETEDEIELGAAELKGKRQRTWSSCMLGNFAEISNHNFRPELKDRIYNWYFHKFVRMPKEYGFSGCVDCNRCSIYCPAKINYRKTLARVLADYKKRPKK